MKHVVRAIISITVFVIATALFSGIIRETGGVGKAKSIAQGTPTFPIMYVKTQGYTINVLRGYNSNLKAAVDRESMTPVGADRQISLIIQEDEITVRKIIYELRNVNDNTLISQKEMAVMEETKAGKVATLTLDSSMEQGKEYALKVTGVSKDGKKIHYFTHIKYYGDDCYLKEKLEFVNRFHQYTLDKTKIEKVASYLEWSYTNNNDTYANLDITSSKELISWGSLSPEVISEIVPTIKEFNIETASVCLQYMVKIQSNNGEEICRVKEFFRVRYAGGRMYLLKYNRDMSTLFDLEKTSLSNKEFKLGITNLKGVQCENSPEGSYMAFVTNGEVWGYSTTKNVATRIFSFLGDSQDYVRAGNDSHNAQIINVDDDGNVDFMVYGYMNAGDYEGCVGILWYRYKAAENRIEEQVFIPMETTYQMLKENIDPFTYVSSGGVFYFSVDNVIYAYDSAAKSLKIIATDVEEGDYAYVKSAGVLAWQKNAEDKKSRKVLVLNLEKNKTKAVTTDKDERIILVGSVNTNIVYGIAKTSDIEETEDGTVITPMYKICIVDNDGNLLKNYKPTNCYVSRAYVEDDVVKLELIKRENGSYVNVRKQDSIQNQMSSERKASPFKKRVTEKNLTEYYLLTNSQSKMDKLPNLKIAKNTLITENKIIRLDGNAKNLKKYYVYGEGVILDSYTSPAKAIMAAEDAMGVVINQNNQLVYERAGKYTNHQIGNITPKKIGININSKGAALVTLFAYQHVKGDAEQLSQSSHSAYALMKKYLGKNVEVINLKGCTLDEVLYFVSGNRPVIAMTQEGSFHLIVGYTETSVTYVNFATGKAETKGLSSMEAVWKAGGNAFIGYLNEG